MNILIADSGSSKTKWCLYSEKEGTKEIIHTQGINPYYQDSNTIRRMLEKEFPAGSKRADRIFFYGAGCANPTVNDVVKTALSKFFNTGNIAIDSDLMGAARSLCGHQPGITCILGTGSNSCFYDGQNITHHIFALGFIFGDDGSGSELGEKLLTEVLKNLLPPHLITCFFEEYKVTPAEIMDNIYHSPFPNRYAARFARFIIDHVHEPSLKTLVEEEFIRFFRRNVIQYPQFPGTVVHFTGSIAYHFREILKDIAGMLEINTGKIVLEPLDGLIEYHLSISP